MSIDCDWGRRMDMLLNLMQLCPDKPMIDLQREALKYFPLYHKENFKAWLSFKTAMAAAERLNQREGLDNVTNFNPEAPSLC